MAECRFDDGDRSVWSLALLPWFDAGRTSAVAQGAWAGFVGLTMNKAVLLLLAADDMCNAH